MLRHEASPNWDGGSPSVDETSPHWGDAVSLRGLRTLIAVAETGTFSRAAEVVCVSHAAVSQQIKALEQELGAPLFDRTKRPPELTPLGRAVLAEARKVLEAYDGLVATAQGEQRLIGELSLGAVPTTLGGLMPRAIRFLRAAYPEMRLRIAPGMSMDLVTLVERGAVDAAVISKPPTATSTLRWRPFLEEPLVAISSLKTRGDDALALLTSHPFIRFTRRAVVGEMIEGWLRAQNLQVNELMESETLETVFSMVSADLGVSIVPRPLVPSAAQPLCRIITLTPPSPPRVLGLAHRADTPKHGVLDALLEILRGIGDGRLLHMSAQEPAL